MGMKGKVHILDEHPIMYHTNFRAHRFTMKPKLNLIFEIYSRYPQGKVGRYKSQPPNRSKYIFLMLVPMDIPR